MKYKVITDFGLGDIYIEHYATLEVAICEFNKAIKDEADFVYLLETIHFFHSSGDSVDKVLSFFKK